MSYEHIAKHLIADQAWDIVKLCDEFSWETRMSEMDLANAIYKIVMEARDAAYVEELDKYFSENQL